MVGRHGPIVFIDVYRWEFVGLLSRIKLSHLWTHCINQRDSSRACLGRWVISNHSQCCFIKWVFQINLDWWKIMQDFYDWRAFHNWLNMIYICAFMSVPAPLFPSLAMNVWQTFHLRQRVVSLGAKCRYRGIWEGYSFGTFRLPFMWQLFSTSVGKNTFMGLGQMVKFHL